jgi:hypothetical protein
MAESEFGGAIDGVTNRDPTKRISAVNAMENPPKATILNRVQRPPSASWKMKLLFLKRGRF